MMVSTANAQQCTGLPQETSAYATYLRSSPGRTATSSIGYNTGLGKRPLYLVGEAGLIDAHTPLLDKNGWVGSAIVVLAPRIDDPRWHPCVYAGRSTGSAPSAAGTSGASLNATVLAAGTGFDLMGHGNTARASMFAAWQYAKSDASDGGGVLRAGLLFTPYARWFGRVGYDRTTDGPAAAAINVSIGARLR